MTAEQIAEQVAARLKGVVSNFQAFGKPFTLDTTVGSGTVYDEHGTPIWEFEEDQDWFIGKTAEFLGGEIEKIFWYDQEQLESENSQE